MRDMTALRDAIAKSIKERDFSDGWTPRDVQDACAEIAYEVDSAVPAATQEPAGSGVSEQRIQELAMVLAKRVLRVTRVDITSADSEEKARELLTLLVGPQPGSPRKVGEDGASVNNLPEKWRQSCSVGPLFKDGTLEPVDVREGVLRCADELETSLKLLGRACAKKARQLGFDVGDGDWWDTDEIVVGLLRAGRERALASVAAEVRILKSMAEHCNNRGMAETPQREWTPYQGKIIAYDCVLVILERSARSSSVPVGEQKQEEGV